MIDVNVMGLGSCAFESVPLIFENDGCDSVTVPLVFMALTHSFAAPAFEKIPPSELGPGAGMVNDVG